MKKVAVADIGSYSILCSLFQEDQNGYPLLLNEIVKVTELLKRDSSGSFLSPEGIDKVITVLNIAREEFGEKDLIAVGTQAFREARNRDSVLKEIRDRVSIELKILSPEEEASLSWLGAITGLILEFPVIAVMDIGGGSTELTIGVKDEESIISNISIPVGVAKLSRVREETINEKLQVIREKFFEAPQKEVIFCGGTITTLTSLIKGNNRYYDRELVHGSEITIFELKELYNKFRRMNSKEFMEFLGCFKDRAGVIKQGCFFIIKIMEELKLNTIKISDRGLRWGIAIKYFRGEFKA